MGGAKAQTTEPQAEPTPPQIALPNPVRYEAFYDIKQGLYFLYPKVGNIVSGVPIAMTPSEYADYVRTQGLRNYYQEKSNNNDLVNRKDPEAAEKKGLLPSLKINNKLFETVFGGNKIELIPQGFASFDLGGLYQKIDNPMVLPQNRKNFAFNIQQRIQLGILGKVGENLQLKANYDTQSGFAFENKLNLVWQAKGTWQDLQTKGLGDLNKGGEDKIIKRVEFGNVNMPLSTSLIRGSESLFGLKTEFQLGKTYGTLVLSQQQGESRTVVAQGGGTMSTFKINAIDYEDNQHYYLGQYFFKNYDNALLNYPQINAKINITRLEVWVLDQGSGNLQDQKSIVAVRDLGEGISGYPNNAQNNLYQSINNLGAGLRDANTAYNTINQQSFPNASGTVETYTDGEQFIFNRRARRLNQNEYKFHPQLGYISLNQRLNDNQLLAVSYSFTVNGSNQVYKVGEFSEESTVLVTKLIKPNVLVKTTSPMWNLMMKNIYSMNANQIARDRFFLNVYYRDPQNGKVNYLPNTPIQNTNLLSLLNWDRLNLNNDLQNDGGSTYGDGLFDFVRDITIDPENGKLIFTKAQPFGNFMINALGSNDPKFVFSELYSQQKQVASQNPLAQRYTIEGRYQGSQGQGIALGAINVPKGSVKVTANGVALTEGVDYTVDYLLGQVTIINETLKQSGQAINISLENQMTFNTQRKRFLGLNLERKFNEHLTVGATAMNYSERPLTQKVQIGQEAVNNTMLGMNVMYNNELPFLTRLTDKIPLINTEAPSNLNFRAEAAYLIPGENKDINNQAYVDDFDQSTSKITLKEPALWTLASKPEKNTRDPLFSNSGLYDDVKNGYGRGLLSWYYIDPRFYGVGGKAPNGINAEAVSNHASRRVKMNEIYNSRDFVAGDQTFVNTLDITYYPTQRGPYNVNPNNEATSERWAGLMRPINVSNFTSANIEYVEFWMMDPYADGKPLGANPKLLLHLGNVSEDILKDGKLQYENGLPTLDTPAKTSQTSWGVQPDQQPVLYAFSSEGENRTVQDVGFDGLDNVQEATKFNSPFVNPVTNLADPAADDFVFYLSNQFQGALASSLVERYRYFRNPEGNSKAGSMEVSSQMPDAEDINNDFNLDQSESYNQYSISLDRADLTLGKNFIVDEKETEVKFQNGQIGKNKWFLFRIPVSQFDTDAGDASAAVLNNVRFARMILKGFDETSTLRFGTFDLVRSDWRKYTKNLAVGNNSDEGSYTVDNANFDVGGVNLEENALGTPPYVMPPGIERQVLSGTTGSQRQNEASLYLKATNLSPTTHASRGVFKNVSLDMRRYQKLELFVHAENLKEVTSNRVDPEAKFFIRFGSDATDNYYEYESSLKYTAISATSPLDIWPMENNVNLDLQDFINAKLRRESANVGIDQRYRDIEYGDAHKAIYTKGRPTLGNISTIVIGVRNTGNDSKDLVLWVDEVRLSGIENKGGYAANASLNFNLGDFANVNANATISTIGFGFIDQKPVQRQQTQNTAFSINTTVNVDKFLPEKVGMKIPVNYSYSQTIEDPKYNPLNDDVLFAEDPKKEELKQVVRTYTQQRSIGVVNMRKERVNSKKKPKFYDVENLSVTAMYNDDYYRDIYTKKNYRQNLKAYVDYNFSFKPWVIKPFNNLVKDTAKSAKYLQWVKAFNVNPIPTRFSFRTEIDRDYSELEFRNIEALMNGTATQNFDVLKNRNFYFGWQYNLGFNLTKSLKLDINSATRTLNDDWAVQTMDTKSIFQNPFRVGRPVLYNHRVQLNYKLPFEHFPYLDFISAEVGYGFQYNWNARSTVLLNSANGNLGNLAQNTNNKVATASADIPTLLGKFNYFKKIDSIRQGRNREIDSLNQVYEKAFADNKSRKKFKFKSYQFKHHLSVGQQLMSALTSIKQVNFNYTENNGTMLPGILSEPNFFGVGKGVGGPTTGFLFGSQADIRRIAVENNWVTSSDYLNEPYTQMRNENITANIAIEPMKDLRIDLNFLRTYNKNMSHSGFNIDIDGDRSNGVQFSFANEMISYSHTDFLLGTAFTDGGEIFNQMKAKAREISRQHNGTLTADGFVEGYSIANSYVLVPAFRAALAGKSSTTVGQPTKPSFPLPNWRITYSGLRNIPFINSQFQKFDLQHAYTSTFTATGIQSNIDFYSNQGSVDIRGDKINPYVFSQVMYQEDFSPLIGADVTMRNNMQFRAQYNRSRMFLLGLVNHTLTEDSGSEYVLGFGYILKDLQFKLKFRGKTKNIKSDLNIRADFSLRDNKTRITNILLDDAQITGGQRMMGIKLSADYNMSQNLNLRFFYDQLMTKYKISTAFPLSTIRAGLSATFTFGGAGVQ
ncbi:cell surface protein SprA [Riemerella columbina]|uniref:T9SS outer membrane translocon Sov/SprA n=1 Tax=Riemerella columbina TaxID=103810 RepID=UPI00266F4DD8|nr:cell surface protein SprA [Riemerella columbina]WKS96140.1 cell surface protein SprA [Riemerella columbina]